MASSGAGTGRQRRWAGPFRVCPACGKRSFVGRSACVSCGASLRGASLPEHPEPGILTGRRGEDRIGGRGVWIGIGAAVLAGVVLGFYVNRTFRTGRWALGLPSEAAAAPRPTTRADRAEPASEPNVPGVEARASYQKGRRLLAAGDAQGALASLSNAVRALTNDAVVAHEYGTALMQTGEHDRGLFHLERAARLAPGIVSYRVDLARALAAAGRRGHASRELEAVLRRDPSNAEAAEALAGLGGPSAAGEASPSPGGSMDLGGAARDPESPRPGTGTAFTNEDLDRRRGMPPLSGIPPTPPASPSPPG